MDTLSNYHIWINMHKISSLYMNRRSSHEGIFLNPDCSSAKLFDFKKTFSCLYITETVYIMLLLMKLVCSEIYKSVDIFGIGISILNILGKL
jgi:hypothetical protein